MRKDRVTNGWCINLAQVLSDRDPDSEMMATGWPSLEELGGVINSEAIRAQRMRKSRRDGRTHFGVVEGIPS